MSWFGRSIHYVLRFPPPPNSGAGLPRGGGLGARWDAQLQGVVVSVCGWWKREKWGGREKKRGERGRWGDEGCPSLRKEDDRNVKRSRAQGKWASSRSYCVVSQIGLPRSAVVVDAPLASRPLRTDATSGKTDAMRPARSLCSSRV
jgi:hypothetical protein